MIPERLNDLTTVFEKNKKHHTTLTHLGCVLLRILLGLLIYFKVKFFKNPIFLFILYTIIISLFSYKLVITKNQTWKVYLRTILLYLINIIINLLDKYKYKIYDNQIRNVSGLLIILDGIMGLQSRHIQKNFIN